MIFVLKNETMMKELRESIESIELIELIELIERKGDQNYAN